MYGFHQRSARSLANNFRFAIRRAAARALASPSLAAPIRSRSIRTSSLVLSKWQQRTPAQTLSASWQRRWASDDADSRGEPAGGSIGETIANAARSTQEAIDQSSAPEVVKDAAAAVTRTVARSDNSNTVFVGNLYYHVKEESLIAKFSEFGNVVSANMATDQRGMSRGYAFVDFDSPEAKNQAIEAMHETMFEGRQVIVAPANARKGASQSGQGSRNATSGDLQGRRRPVTPPSRTLFIGNMSYDMTDSDLNSLFRPLKNVVDVRVAIDRRTGQARGFAHADFADVESATKGKEFLEQQMTYGRRLKVDYAASFGPDSKREPAAAEEPEV